MSPRLSAAGRTRRISPRERSLVATPRRHHPPQLSVRRGSSPHPALDGAQQRGNRRRSAHDR